MLRAIQALFFFFLLARLNWFYDVIICLVRLTQIFATADHNIKTILEIATFLQNQFIEKPIFNLISQLIFKLYSTN